MTNNTIPNVPRELLEELRDAANESMNATTRQHQIDHFAGLIAKADALLSAPSPAGVDDDYVPEGLVQAIMQSEEVDAASLAAKSLKAAGVDGLGNTANLLLPALRQYMHNDGSGLLAGYDLETTQAIIDGLRGEVGAQRIKTCTALKERNDAREERDAVLVECERRQMQLAACGVVALANTIESAGEARQMHPDYMSASCSDVADAVDREIALRDERDTLRQQLALRDEEIERVRVQLMTIASAEPARHSIEWAKAMASTGNNEVYAKWREAFDQRDQHAQRIGELEAALEFACKSLAQVTSSDGSGHADIAVSVMRMAGRKEADASQIVEAYKAGAKWRIDAALSAGKDGA